MAVFNPNGLPNGLENAQTNVNGSGKTVRFLLERMCAAAGSAAADNCILQPTRSAPYYRAYVRVGGPRGTVAVSQTMLETRGNFVPRHALLAKQRLDVSSTINITGAGSGVDSNTHVKLSGASNVQALGTLSAAGPSQDNTSGVYCSGSCNGSGCNNGTTSSGTGLTSNAAPELIPQFNPWDIRSRADFVLHSDGSVTNRLGEVLMTTAQGHNGGTTWLGWKYSAPSVGSRTERAADGGSGSHHRRTCTQTAAEALIIAREQIVLSGETTIRGAVIATNTYDVDTQLHENLGQR